MIRIAAIFALVLACATLLYADPADDALRVQRYHDRLVKIGTGPATSIWVLLLDGEELKGTIYYLNDTELGIRDDFGHRRPVMLKGIVEFTAHNRDTHLKTASRSWWHRTVRQFWQHMSGRPLSRWAAQDAFRFVIIDRTHQGGAIV